ncbi:hypothetical protein SUGI_0219240 [Cryptomeria japonica]|nr:hypothetical protein SUGI_0219240 [Cryptomeria japonica]
MSEWGTPEMNEVRAAISKVEQVRSLPVTPKIHELLHLHIQLMPKSPSYFLEPLPMTLQKSDLLEMTSSYPLKPRPAFTSTATWLSKARQG